MRTKQRRFDSGALLVVLVQSPTLRIKLSRPSWSECVCCGQDFALEIRQTADGTVRDQPRCPKCRGVKGKVTGARRRVGPVQLTLYKGE